MNTEFNSSDELLENWAYFVQSPAQLAFSRCAKFPPHSTEKLVTVLDIQPGEQILEIGGGLGILSGRILSSGRPATVTTCEVNPTYIRASVPDSLSPPQDADVVRGDGFSLPFAGGRFDRVLTHAIATLMNESNWRRLHREIQRVCSAGATVTHMDNLGNDRWEPESLRPGEAERERDQQFRELLLELHRSFGTGYARTARDLPRRMRQVGVRDVTVSTYSWALDLADPRWSEKQQRDLLELWNQFEKDRFTRVQRLLDRTNEETGDYEELLEQYEQDLSRRAKRRRRHLEDNRYPGWYSSTTLLATGTP